MELENIDAVENVCRTMANVPFNLFDSFLFEFKMFKLPNKKGGFILNAHHLIFDAWSSSILINQVMNDYQDLSDDANSNSYIDHIVSEQKYLSSDKFVKDKEYWTNVFTSIPDPISIPVSNQSSNSSISSYSMRKDFSVSKSLQKRINKFCAKNKISNYAFFMAVYSVYLARINNTTNFSFGTPVLNRSNYQEKNTVGLLFLQFLFVLT